MEMVNRKYPVNMFRVCIEEDENQISGRIYSPMSMDVIFFSDMTELLLKMDKLFDKVGYPQAFQIKRSFADEKESSNAYRGIPHEVRDTETILSEHGAKGTYDVIVISRRNTSWQGEVYGTNNERKGNFDGEVELLALLTALTEA